MIVPKNLNGDNRKLGRYFWFRKRVSLNYHNWNSSPILESVIFPYTTQKITNGNLLCLTLTSFQHQAQVKFLLSIRKALMENKFYLPFLSNLYWTKYPVLYSSFFVCNFWQQ